MTNKLADILGLARIQIVLIVFFVFFKFIRPPVLDSNSPAIFKSLLLSLPNFFEAVIGTLILTGLGLILNDQLNHNRSNLNLIYLLAVVFAGIYVIAQELKIHNLGGENITDINDIIYSMIGLFVGYAIVLHKKPRIHDEE